VHCVQCLKLSPNLRRQSKEVKAALLNKDLKKAGEMEIKKLDQLLGQVAWGGLADLSSLDRYYRCGTVG
jgi:hypothetical protein